MAQLSCEQDKEGLKVFTKSIPAGAPCKWHSLFSLVASCSFLMFFGQQPELLLGS